MQVILGDQALGPSHLQAILKAAAIILPQACPQELYKVCARSRAQVFPHYGARMRYPGKVGQHGLFQEFALPCPQTRCWKGVRHFEQAGLCSGRLAHDFPFLIKQDLTHEGEGVFFIEDQVRLNKTLEYLRVRERSGPRAFVSQDYVPCQGNALRAVIVGKQTLTYWKRPRSSQEVITTSAGGQGWTTTGGPTFKRKGEDRRVSFLRKPASTWLQWISYSPWTPGTLTPCFWRSITISAGGAWVEARPIMDFYTPLFESGLRSAASIRMG